MRFEGPPPAQDKIACKASKGHGQSLRSSVYIDLWIDIKIGKRPMGRLRGGSAPVLWAEESMDGHTVYSRSR